ncbi:AAA family ATPase [Polyangium mundeleinium]|uniref:AAA family ATPase n=1 Tax=Polyangium mundeleinium TaxID=2995306 RepID=A0ABT5ENJ1_9BACT|nr:AAA family ATPase [Polyangium mundeleinium]MDC0743316.1 AAA family ATPase [Polyangium mundeleinium]
MLRKLSVKNFRLLRDVTIDVEPGKPIVLIGPNGSGKSSVIQVLDLLSRWAGAGFVAGCHAFDGFWSLMTSAPDVEETRIDLDIEFSPNDPILHYGMGACSPGRITQEILEKRPSPGVVPNALVDRQAGNLVLWNERRQVFEDQAISLHELSFESVRQVASYPSLAGLQSALSSIRIYDGFLTTPLWTRSPQEGKFSPFDGGVLSMEPHIDRRGLALVNALYFIKENEDEHAWNELLYALRSEFPFVDRLEFPPEHTGGRISLQFRDKRYPSTRFSGHQMSEGMATYLCLLAAILSPEPTMALAFDEPDRHLHPSALRRIVYLLERASEHTAVFVTTHSDRFLDYLSDPAGSIRICEPTAEGVKLRMLNREALDEWREHYSLQELRAQGHLDPANADDPLS